MPAPNRCKGIVFKSFRDVVSQEHSAAAWEKVVAATGEEVRSALSYGAVVPGGWYPLAWYAELHRATQATLGIGAEFALHVGRVSTRQDLGVGIYKVFLKIVSPQFVISNAAKVFSSYYESGRMRIDEKRKGFARASWSDCADFDANIWQDVFGGCQGALEAAGARQVALQILGGGAEGDLHAELTATWM